MAAQPFSSLVLFASPRGTGDGDLPLCSILMRLICLCPYPLLTEPVSISLCPIPISEHAFVLIPILCMSLSCLLMYVSNSCLCLHPSLSLSVSSLSLSLPFSVFLPVSCVSVHIAVSVFLWLHMDLHHISVSLCSSSLTLSALPSFCLPLCVSALVHTPACGHCASLA